MIARTSRASSGFSAYMKSGKKVDSDLKRNDKDNVIPLYGNLNNFERAEKYTNDFKEWSDNYTHITISFNKEDMKRLDEHNQEDRIEILKNISVEYIKHHTSGYDLENEIVAYAEVHQPKIKFENGFERFEHIHIGISHLNILSDTKIRTTFANNAFIDDTLQTYINKKYDLTQPREYKRVNKEKLFNSKIGIERKQLVESLKQINNRMELETFLNDNGIDFKKPTKKYPHYKIINPKGSNINLRGRGFEHLEGSYKKSYKESMQASNDKKSYDDLENVLKSYYQDRVEMIDSRRSEATKKQLKNIKDEENFYIEEAERLKKKDKRDKSIKAILFQEKIIYEHYKHFINLENGYFVDTKNKDIVKFINKKKNINVVDDGETIFSNNENKTTKEEVKLMLDIAVAKGWDIFNLEINGKQEFQNEMQMQIRERKTKKTLSFTEAERKRPVNNLQYEFQKIEDVAMEEKSIDLKLLKVDLVARTVLKYAIDKYKLNADEYEVTDDNKINNLTNRQKPKNCIDFLQKEANLSGHESIEINRKLYKEQIKSAKEIEKTELLDVNDIDEIISETSKNKVNKSRKRY